VLLPLLLLVTIHPAIEVLVLALVAEKLGLGLLLVPVVVEKLEKLILVSKMVQTLEK
jgi:hypothetical protein